MRVFGVVAFVLLVGCIDREIGQQDPLPSNVEVVDVPVELNRELDLLFVIDNSPSMIDEQAGLGANFGRFIDMLDNIDGGLPDVHIGVVTSNMGSLGMLQQSPECRTGDGGALQPGAAQLDGGARFIVDVAGAAVGERIDNLADTTTLTAAFDAMARVGSGGCIYEQHLESMKAALSDNPVNSGFRRPNAHLAVIFIADEDDCSVYAPGFFDQSLGVMDSFRCFAHGVVCDGPPDPATVGPRTNCRPRDDSQFVSRVSEYVDFLRGMDPPDGEVIVAGIVGDREPVSVAFGDPGNAGIDRPYVESSCTLGQETQSADPAVRLATFLDGFELAVNRTICDDDLSDAMTIIGNVIGKAVGNACIQGVLPADPECTVSLVTPSGEQVIPACDATNSRQPCWRLIEDTVQCDDYPTRLKIDVVSDIALPTGTRVTASCVVE